MINGYWDEFTGFMRGLFNATFKTNPYLERAIMTGITRVSKESEEKTLEETVQTALAQIEAKKYDAELLELGVSKEHIRHYGFAFEGKI